MKQIERASIVRIVSDLIKADGIIDTREIEFLDEKKSGQKFWERYQKREQKLRQIKAEIDQNEKMLDVMKHSRLWRAYRIFKKL